jgi:hypothetical protein
VSEVGLYSVSGAVCGDVGGRDFNYPPALFHGFFWVESFSYEQAVAIWDGLMAASMIAVGAAWAWVDGRLRRDRWSLVLAIFWLMLLAQFPFVFALERSNNDVIPVLLWTAAAAFFIRQRFVVSGGFAGLAIALKVYPIVAFVVVAIGTVRVRWRIAALVGLGCAIGGLVASVFWWDETIEYVTKVLPSFANLTPELAVYSHTLSPQVAGPVVTAALGAALLASWVIVAWRRLATAPLLVFGGALAISTYFSSTSYDYNLITTYPLLLLVVARALEPGRIPAWKAAALAGIVTIVAGRGIFTPAGQLVTQIATLISIAWLVVVDGDAANPSDTVPSGRG